jgi:hypothetical protein
VNRKQEHNFKSCVLMLPFASYPLASDRKINKRMSEAVQAVVVVPFGTTRAQLYEPIESFDGEKEREGGSVAQERIAPKTHTRQDSSTQTNLSTSKGPSTPPNDNRKSTSLFYGEGGDAKVGQSKTVVVRQAEMKLHDPASFSDDDDDVENSYSDNPGHDYGCCNHLHPGCVTTRKVNEQPLFRSLFDVRVYGWFAATSNIVLWVAVMYALANHENASDLMNVIIQPVTGMYIIGREHSTHTLVRIPFRVLWIAMPWLTLSIVNHAVRFLRPGIGCRWGPSVRYNDERLADDIYSGVNMVIDYTFSTAILWKLSGGTAIFEWIFVVAATLSISVFVAYGRAAFTAPWHEIHVRMGIFAFLRVITYAMFWANAIMQNVGNNIDHEGNKLFACVCSVILVVCAALEMLAIMLAWTPPKGLGAIASHAALLTSRVFVCLWLVSIAISAHV